MPAQSTVTATLLLLAAVGVVNAQTDTKTRVGTCADARSQMEYFCNEANANKNNDMMMSFNACSNAKKNVKEACEGIVEPDVEYKFDKQ